MKQGTGKEIDYTASTQPDEEGNYNNNLVRAKKKTAAMQNLYLDLEGQLRMMEMEEGNSIITTT